MATIKLNGQIITSISGSLKQCSLLLKGKPFGKGRPALPSQKLRRHTMSKKQAISQSHGKRLKDHPSKIKWQDGKYCACDAYLLADWLWRRQRICREEWRHAVKKPGLTGYDLWIMEATYLAKLGLYFPEHPSNSGGWSRKAAIPGHTYQPPADCVSAPPQIGNFFKRAWWTLERKKLHWLAFYGVNPACFPGHMIIDETWAYWHYDPKNPDTTALFKHRFDNFASAHKINNPLWPERSTGLLEIFIKTTRGTIFVYQQDRMQLDGLDLAALHYCTHTPNTPYQAAGQWE